MKIRIPKEAEDRRFKYIAFKMSPQTPRMWGGALGGSGYSLFAVAKTERRRTTMRSSRRTCGTNGGFTIAPDGRGAWGTLGRQSFCAAGDVCGGSARGTCRPVHREPHECGRTGLLGAGAGGDGSAVAGKDSGVGGGGNSENMHLVAWESLGVATERVGRARIGDPGKFDAWGIVSGQNMARPP
jgi:hypothetical protein